MQHSVKFYIVQKVWTQSFPSPRLVAIKGLNNSVCPIIYT